MMFADERTAQTSCCAASSIPVIPLPPQPFCSLAAVLPPSVYLPWFIVLFAVPLLQQAPAIWNANIRPSEMGMYSPSFVWISDDKSQRKEQGSQSVSLSVCVWPQCGQIQLLKLWVHAHRFAVFALILGPLTPEIAAHLAPVSCRFTAEWQTKPWWSRRNWTNMHPNTLRCTRVFVVPQQLALTRLMIPLSVRVASIIGTCFYSSITGRLVMQGGRRQKWPPHFPPLSLLSKPTRPPPPFIYSPLLFISAVLLFSSRSWVMPETD